VPLWMHQKNISGRTAPWDRGHHQLGTGSGRQVLERVDCRIDLTGKKTLFYLIDGDANFLIDEDANFVGVSNGACCLRSPDVRTAISSPVVAMLSLT